MNPYSVLEKVFGKAADESVIFNVPRIKPPISKGLIAIGAIGAEAIKINAASKLGPITSGRLSDMTDSVGISPKIQQLQKDRNEENLKCSITNSGASSEIARALYNLR